MHAPRRRPTTEEFGRTRRRRWWALPAVIAFISATAIAVPVGAVSTDDRAADLVLINGISPADVGFDVPIDALVDGECTVVDLDFAGVTFGLDFDAGRHRLTITQSDGACGGLVLVDTTVELTAGEDVTSIVHLDADDNASMTTYRDNTTGLGRNRARVVFANLSGAESLDLNLARSGRRDLALDFPSVEQSRIATGETWIGKHVFDIAEPGRAPFYDGELDLGQNASVSLYGVGQTPGTFTLIENRRPTGEDPGLNGVFVTVANTFTVPGADRSELPYGNRTAGRIGPGVEVPTSQSGFTYTIDVDGQGISMVWDTDNAAIDDIEGVQEDEFVDIYTFTFAEPILAGLQAAAVASASLVPDVEIISDTELVVTTGPGTEIGDGFDARIVLSRSGAVGTPMPVQPGYGLDDVFVTASNLVRVDGGDEFPFGNRTAARVGDDVEINPSQSGFDYLIDVDATSVRFIWDQSNPLLDEREGAIPAGVEDIYVLTFAEPVLADLRAEVDQGSSLVPFVEVISDTELVVIMGEGDIVGDGRDAVINLVD